MNNIHDFFIYLQRQGMGFLNVYDIGACKGEWTNAMKFGGLKASNFFLFEANPEHVPYLQNTGFPYFVNCLSKPGQEFVTFYTNNSTGDSYYKENTKWFDQVNGIQVSCTTIDSLIQKHNLPIPNLVKMDTQGSELDILEGASSLLGRTPLFYVECPIVTYNTGAPNIQQYLEYFIKKDYIPIDVFEIHQLEHTLIQIDIMFMLREYKERYLGENNYVRVTI